MLREGVQRKKEFIEKQRQLLKLEYGAEQSIRIKDKPIRQASLINIIPNSTRRTELKFTTGNGTHNIQPGNIVNINMGNKKQTLLGCIKEVTPNEITVVCRNSTWDIDKKISEVTEYGISRPDWKHTYTLYAKTLKRIEEGTSEVEEELLYPTVEPRDRQKPGGATNLANQEKLNLSQAQAIQFCMNDRQVGVIQGGPGTGKTATIIAIIETVLGKGGKIMICTPSNQALDTVMCRLIEKKIKMIRIGQSPKMMEQLDKYTLAYMEDSYTPATSMKNNSQQQKKQRQRQILGDQEVFFSTLSKAHSDGPIGLLNPAHLDVVVIDEAAQAKEIEAWLITHMAPKIILVGDTNQLPPTILSGKARSLGLGVSLMERLVKQTNGTIVKSLQTQHRTNEKIMKWISHNIYNNTISTETSCKNRCLAELPHVVSNDITSKPLRVIDTGTNAREVRYHESITNPQEAKTVSKLVENMVKCGVREQEISIITPYRGQVQELNKRIADKFRNIQIRTIDASQGSENEAIIISMVRSNKDHKIGFLQDRRRINVALTRPRRQLTVIGDWQTLKSNPLLNSFFKYAIENNCIEEW